MEIKYYDESYYLSSFGEDERKILEYWKEKNKSDNEISLDNSISKGLMISVLVQAGAFSYDEFEGKNVDDILNSRIGLNVINGIGCCRNVSNFMTDIFNVNNEFCENLGVISLDKKDKRKATRNEANHMINLIRYDGVLYGFDPLDNFGSLYYFFNSFELLPIEPKK